MVEKSKTLNISMLKVLKVDVMCVHIVGGRLDLFVTAADEQVRPCLGTCAAVTAIML